MTQSRKGITAALGAYALWGLLPLYWKLLKTVPAPQILGHRVVWSCVFLAGLVTLRREWPGFRAAARNRRVLGIYTGAAAILAVNWLIYIWAVNTDHIVETSLGYFINPLLTVLLSVCFLHEHLRRLQWLAVLLAAAGVSYLTWQHGRVPWIALALAVSFAIYGLLKKQAPLGALHGLMLETAVLLLPALGFLAAADARGTGAFGHTGWQIGWLLAFTGLVTALPLLLFALAARRVSLSTLGILQYLAPTCQFLIGVAVYREPFNRIQLTGFTLIWTALLLYWLDGALRLRRLAWSSAHLPRS
jgi:chloramphenicol-sensitive protein RarD